MPAAIGTRTARCGHAYDGPTSGTARTRCGPDCQAPASSRPGGRPVGWRPGEHGADPGGRPPKDGVRAGRKVEVRLDQEAARAVLSAVRPGETRSATVVRLLDLGAHLRAVTPDRATDPSALPTGAAWSAASAEDVRLTSALSDLVESLRAGGVTRSQVLRALLADGLRAVEAWDA